MNRTISTCDKDMAYCWVYQKECSRPRRPRCRWVNNIKTVLKIRICDLLARVPGCYPRGSGFDSRRNWIFCVVVGLERDPISPFEDKWGATWKKSSSSGLGRRRSAVLITRHPSIHKSWQFRRQVAVARSVWFTFGLRATEFVFFFLIKLGQVR
jgi:hypothetical protein